MAIPKRRPVGDQALEGVTLDRHPGGRRDPVEHARLEHVRPGVDQVARFGPGCRLLDEAPDASVVVELDDTERRWIVDPDEVQRGLGAESAVGGDEGADVEIGQHVTVGDDERVVDAGGLGREPDRSGGVERLGLDGVASTPTSPQRPSGNASMNGSGLKPSASMTSLTPPRTRLATVAR